MKVSLKEEHRGVLALTCDPLTGVFSYILKHYSYPSYEEAIVKVEEGDELAIRSNDDGSVIVRRVVEFDFDSYRQMDTNTGKYYQMINGHRVMGVQKNIEPAYWLNLFLSGHRADLIKTL